MQNRILLILGLATLATIGSLITISWTSGQPLESPKKQTSSIPRLENRSSTLLSQSTSNPIVESKTKSTVASSFQQLKQDPSVSLVTRQLLPTFQQGLDFLLRTNQSNGRFLNGWIVSLNRPLEGDHFLKQCLCAFAFTRTARFTSDEKISIRAQQTILALLAETQIDPTNPGARQPIHPNQIANRLASAGYLMMMIHELPNAADDLIAKSEELGQFIKMSQKPDGSLQGPEDSPDREEMLRHAGPALYGVILSNRSRPVEWKLEALKKAAKFYRGAFQNSPNLEMIPSMTAAFSEAYEQSKEPIFAEFVLEMNDWLCKFQYDQKDSLHSDWRGGFQELKNGKPSRSIPTMDTAKYAQSLADACRMLHALPQADLQRFNTYRTTLQRSLQFIANLQYTRETCIHFNSKYADGIVGGFYQNNRDGNIHTEHTAYALSAFIQYFQSGAQKD